MARSCLKSPYPGCSVGRQGTWTCGSGQVLTGGRVGVMVRGGAVQFQELEQWDVGRVTKTYATGGQRIALRRDNALYFVHTDHLGSSSLLTNEQGQQVAGTRLKYFAYGAPRPEAASSTHNAFARGYTPATYTGQTRDASTGLMYYGARFFDPALGIFLAPDSIVPEPGNPAALNRYSYVLGNPLRYTDPTGHANECGIYGGTSCGDYGPKVPVEIVQAPPDALDNIWAVTELIGSVLAEPADWVITARDFLRGNGSPWALVGLLPFVPSSAGKWADEVASGLAKKIDVDLYAFGNKAGPRPPRSGTDIHAGQQLIDDDIAQNELANTRLTHPPAYDSEMPLDIYGMATRNESTRIGPLAIDQGRRETLVTIVHEEMHHRLWARGVPSNLHHPYVERVAQRFARLEGW